MGRRSALVAAASLLFALAACGGDDGGGDESAFCDSLDQLSELVADGDLADDDGLADAVDLANELRENGSDDQQDAITEVGETLSGADADEAADTAELIQDELGDFADDCEIDEFAEAPEEETTTTTEPDETTTTEDPDDTTTTEGGGEPSGELNVVTAAVDPAGFTVEPGFEQLVADCFGGLMQACDDIFFGAEDGSTPAATDQNTRAYGGQCGGRITTFANDTVRCIDNLFAAAPFDVADFEDPTVEGLATACAGDVDAGIDGDMQACDDLFIQTGIGTPEEAYGDTCGGRIDPDVADRGASCVAIFGPTALFG